MGHSQLSSPTKCNKTNDKHNTYVIQNTARKNGAEVTL